jgi:hypothetical protein
MEPDDQCGACVDDGFLALSTAIDDYVKDMNPCASFHKFLDLPVEIRNIVYAMHIWENLNNEHFMNRHLFQDENYDSKRVSVHRSWSWPIMDLYRNDKAPNTSAFPSFMPGICLTSHQVRQEIARFMLGTALVGIWEANLVSWSATFLETLPVEFGFGAVHNLVDGRCLKDFEGHNSNTFIDLMIRCPNVRRVAMKFTLSIMAVRDPTSGQKTPRSLEELLDGIGLRPLLECKQLRQIELVGVGGSNDDQKYLTKLYDIGRWMKRGFEAQDMKVEIRVQGLWDYWAGFTDWGYQGTLV